MLDNLRANKGGIITYLFLFAIIIVFIVSFGPGSLDKGCTAGRSATWAARVNGTTIPAASYERAYQNLLRGLQQQAGPAFSRELAEQMGLQTMALDQLVERTLAVDEAGRRGLAITDDQLASTIMALPAFETGGHFDRDLYQRTVSSVYGSPARFEAELREELLRQRVMAAVRETVKVPEAEVHQAWADEHDRASLLFVRFPAAAAAAEVRPPSAAEVTAFAASARGRIEAFYAANPARFDEPRRVRARHILVALPADATDAQVAAARARIDGLAARLARGEDFAKVAAEASDDRNTRAHGGDLGVVAEGLVEKPFADAALALAAGTVSAPVRTRAGWHLIRVDEVFPVKKVPLDAARPVIARELLVKDRAEALAQARAAAALAAAGTRPLAELFPAAGGGAKAHGRVVKLGGAVLSAESTGPFGAGTFVPRLGDVPGLAAAALAGTVGKPLPSVWKPPEGPVVAVLERRDRPDAGRYPAERGEVASRLRRRLEPQVEAAWMKLLRDAAKVQVNPAVLRSAAAAADPDAG